MTSEFVRGFDAEIAAPAEMVGFRNAFGNDKGEISRELRPQKPENGKGLATKKRQPWWQKSYELFDTSAFSKSETFRKRFCVSVSSIQRL